MSPKNFLEKFPVHEWVSENKTTSVLEVVENTRWQIIDLLKKNFDFDYTQLWDSINIQSFFIKFKELLEEKYKNIEIQSLINFKLINLSDDNEWEYYYNDIILNVRNKDTVKLDTKLLDWDNFSISIWKDRAKIIMEVPWNRNKFIFMEIAWKDWSDNASVITDINNLYELWVLKMNDTIKLYIDNIYTKYNEKLTWLYNRSIIDKLENVSADYSAIYMDLNLFKQINDVHWHDVWDQALIYFSRLLRSSIRDTDYPIRIWWDEFCVLVKNSETKTRTIFLIENIIKRFEDLLSSDKFLFFTENDKLDLELNISFTSWYSINSHNKLHELKSLSEMITEADSIMIKNKWWNKELYRFMHNFYSHSLDEQTVLLNIMLSWDEDGVFRNDISENFKAIMFAFEWLSKNAKHKVVSMVVEDEDFISNLSEEQKNNIFMALMDDKVLLKNLSAENKEKLELIIK